MQPQSLNKFTLRAKLSILGMFVLVGGVGISVTLAMHKQRDQSSAWYTAQAANASCDDDDGDNDAVIHVRFINIETNTLLGMNVVAKDIETGKEANLGTIAAQQTKSGIIHAERKSLPNGGIIFYLTWSSGLSGSDQRTAGYTGITCAAPTPTAVPTVYTPPTATPTLVPTATLTPTSVPVPTEPSGSTTLSLNLFLDGIGKAGDRVSPGNGNGNMNPEHKTRTVTVQLYNASNTLADTVTGAVTFAASSGSFLGTVDLGNTVTSGPYTVKIKTPQYLRVQVGGIQTIVAGQDNQLHQTSLIAGDINGDNEINIVDYNILMGCYSDLLPPVDCNPANEVMADLTDDGHVNQYDFNLFLRELSNVEGQ